MTKITQTKIPVTIGLDNLLEIAVEQGNCRTKKMDKIKTLNDLINYERHLTQMFDSDVRVAMALLEKIRNIKQKEEPPLCTPDNCRHGY